MSHHRQALLTRLVAAIFAVLGASCHSALADSAPQPPAIVCCASPWSGAYIGVHAGYEWLENDFVQHPFDTLSDVTLRGVTAEGALYGGQFGYNWQKGWLVGGAEIDFSVGDIEGASNSALFEGDNSVERQQVTQEQEYLGSLRGRLGIASNDLLMYATAGIAWERLEHTRTIDVPGLFRSDQKSIADHWGWVAGVGGEVLLGGNWIARAEYLHYDFGSIHFARSATGPEGEFHDRSGTQTADVLRTGLSYRFGEAQREQDPGPCCELEPWAGFYVGIHGGYGKSVNDFSIPFVDTQLLGTEAEGRIIGGLAGHNWQVGHLVVGIEADMGFADIDGASTPVIEEFPDITVGIGHEDHIRYLGSLRGRLGLTPLSSWLMVYGTAGLAWEHIEQTDVIIEAEQDIQATVFRSFPRNRFGWVIGLGGEMLLGDSGLVARVEYLHYDFGQIEPSFTFRTPDEVFASDGGTQTIDTIRAALAFKLGASRAPVDHNTQSSYDWSGGYLGAHAGYVWGENDFFELESLDPFLAFNGIDIEGELLGGLAGYNFQYGRVVAGGEVDFSFSNADGSETVTFPAAARVRTIQNEIKSIATARARIGYAPIPTVLMYGTGGLAWERRDRTETNISPTSTSSNFFSTDHFGWVGGGGVDVALWGGWVGRIEYLHHDFGKIERTVEVDFEPPRPIGPLPSAGDHTVEEVRAAIIYKFN